MIECFFTLRVTTTSFQEDCVWEKKKKIVFGEKKELQIRVQQQV
jgi:predicted Rdx family selenoprotein